MLAVFSEVFQLCLPVSHSRWSCHCCLHQAKKEMDPACRSMGRDVSPGLHGSKQCHPLSLTSTCTTTDLLEPHHVAAPESWSVSLPIGLALRIVWGGISPGGRCAIMEAKRRDTCASLSETHHILHYQSAYTIQDNSPVCNLLCRLQTWVQNYEIQRAFSKEMELLQY